ncbi:hypothetical protein EUX98_g6409 [Antrodiella citrinella]|uniref:C2H2-type domain-containing protein n=1 Tax=Antrodiella citrinella TaxID=2447956 RepID=A0A4S4MP27_9APHY|nr:hypothetical protein EUX98_g6409 [Antrodiella citrinella]
MARASLPQTLNVAHYRTLGKVFCRNGRIEVDLGRHTAIIRGILPTPVNFLSVFPATPGHGIVFGTDPTCPAEHNFSYSLNEHNKRIRICGTCVWSISLENHEYWVQPVEQKHGQKRHFYVEHHTETVKVLFPHRTAEVVTSPFYCRSLEPTICLKHFTQAYSLQKHYKTVHNIAAPSDSLIAVSVTQLAALIASTNQEQARRNQAAANLKATTSSTTASSSSIRPPSPFSQSSTPRSASPASSTTSSAAPTVMTAPTTPAESTSPTPSPDHERDCDADDEVQRWSDEVSRSETNVECVRNEAEGAAATDEAVQDTITDINSAFESLDFSEEIVALPYFDFDPFSFSESDLGTPNIDIAFESFSFSESDESLSQNVNENSLDNYLASPLDEVEALTVLMSEVQEREEISLEFLKTLVALSENHVPNMCHLLAHRVAGYFYNEFIDESQCTA